MTDNLTLNIFGLFFNNASKPELESTSNMETNAKVPGAKKPKAKTPKEPEQVLSWDDENFVVLPVATRVAPPMATRVATPVALTPGEKIARNEEKMRAISNRLAKLADNGFPKTLEKVVVKAPKSGGISVWTPPSGVPSTKADQKLVVCETPQKMVYTSKEERIPAPSTKLTITLGKKGVVTVETKAPPYIPPRATAQENSSCFWGRKATVPSVRSKVTSYGPSKDLDKCTWKRGEKL